MFTVDTGATTRCAGSPLPGYMPPRQRHHEMHDVRTASPATATRCPQLNRTRWSLKPIGKDHIAIGYAAGPDQDHVDVVDGCRVVAADFEQVVASQEFGQRHRNRQCL